jgi:Ca2+-binding RTX toxin-like protein
MPTVFFGDFDDSFTVNSDDYTLVFLAGADSLRVNGGTVQAAMGSGDDFVDLRGGTVSAWGEDGNDRFDVYSVGAYVNGNAGNDLINIRGGSGLTGVGWDGDDVFDFLAASTGVALFGNFGNDSFFGHDRAISGTIDGGSGDDIFTGFQSGVTISGGQGNDVYRLSTVSNATFVEAAGEGIDTVQVAVGDSYTLAANIENILVQTFDTVGGPATLTGNGLANHITGGSVAETINALGGDDAVLGLGGDDVLAGNDGNDTLDGGSGNDTLKGGAGNDILQGGAGGDDMAGGTGNDVYYVNSVSDIVTEAAGAGTDSVQSSLSFYQLSNNVENGIIAVNSGATLYGNGSNNALTGGGGDDLISGDAGNDTINGGGGVDTIIGGLGADTLSGNLGDDYFLGQSGADAITGGGGGDTFDYDSTIDSRPTARDHIVDFTSSAGDNAGDDTLDLSDIDADTTVVGDQAFTFNDTGAAAGHPGDMWLTAFGADMMLHFDVNGDSVADMEIVMNSTVLWFDDIIF